MKDIAKQRERKMMNKIIKEFKNKPMQMHASKATGGRIPDVPKEAWEDNGRWVAEKKLDGTRLKWEFTNEGNRFTTRRISEKSNEFMDRTNNFPHLRDLVIPELEGTVIDGEALAPTGSFNNTASIVGSSPEKSWLRQEEFGWLEFHTFDILIYKGEDIRDMPYWQRHKILKDVLKILRGCFPNVPIFLSEQTSVNKLQYYHDTVANNEEGIMLKNLDGKYYDTRWMYKVKRFERVSMIITGFKDGDGKYKGAVGSIGVGFFEEGQLTYASGLSDEDRWGYEKRKEEELGNIVEVEFERYTITGSLRNPRFKGPRPDKVAQDCTRDQNEVKK